MAHHDELVTETGPLLGDYEDSSSRTVDGKQQTKKRIPDYGCWSSEGRAEMWQNRSFYLIISLVGIVQGGNYLSRLAVNYYFKDDLHLSPASLSVATGFIMVPWVIKPVYGFISDSFPIMQRRRQPYFFIFGLFGFTCWMMMSLLVGSFLEALIVLFFASLSLAFVNVLAEALIVEKGSIDKKDPEGTKAKISFLMTIYWGFESFSKIFSGFSSGYLLERVRKQEIFMFTGFFPLTLCFVSLTLGEVKSSYKPSMKRQWDDLNRHLSRPYIYKPALFMFMWMAMPSSQAAYFYFLTNDIGLKPQFMGILHVVEGISSILALSFYHSFLKHIHYRKILYWTILMSVIAGLTPLILITHVNRSWGINDQWFVISDSALLAGVGQVSILPLLILGAQTCPPHVEATLYALLMSILNVGGVVSDNLGGLLTWILGVNSHNFERLWLLTVLCTCLNLVTIPLLYYWVPTDQELSQEMAKAAKEDEEYLKQRQQESHQVDADSNTYKDTTL